APPGRFADRGPSRLPGRVALGPRQLAGVLPGSDHARPRAGGAVVPAPQGPGRGLLGLRSASVRVLPAGHGELGVVAPARAAVGRVLPPRSGAAPLRVRAADG